MKVVWTDRAKQRLREIQEYIAQDAPRAAPQVVRRLVRRSRQLATLPRSGRMVPEYRHDDIRELLERPYRIIYLVLAGHPAAHRRAHRAALSATAARRPSRVVVAGFFL